MIENFKPLYDKVLVKREPKEEKTAGGLFMVSSENEPKNNIGIVLAVGCGRLSANGILTPCLVNVGDKVYFSKYSGQEIDEEHIILGENEIFGTL